MSPALMATEMLEQPDVLARLAERFDDHAERVRAILPQPLGGVVFVARRTAYQRALRKSLLDTARILPRR